MSLDLMSITPQPSNWFSENVNYEGRGRAEFIAPEGVVEGFVKILYDEFGSYSIEMEIDTIEGEQPLSVEHLRLFNDAVPNRIGLTLDYKQSYNICSKLVVSTPDGIFSAIEPIHYKSSHESSRTEGVRVWLRFFPLKGQFDAIKSEAVKFWVIPLSNYLSDFMQKHPSLDRHPLRIYPTPIVPTHLLGMDELRASNKAGEKNQLIIFSFNGALGFIERLPNYKEREDRLLEAREQHIVTSIMVGEVGSKPIDTVESDQWLPLDFLHILGLASGTEVGSLWIEFRDQEGILIRRIHHHHRPPMFAEGHVVIDESNNHGTGPLLTKYSLSQEYGESFLRAVIRNIIRGGSYNISVEQRMSHLFRALDALCEKHNLKKALSPKDTLSEQYKNDLNKIIKHAAKSIDELVRRAESDERQSEATTLREIAQQLHTLKPIPLGFGKAVILLLKKFALPDSDIIEKYYQESPRPDGKKWPNVLSVYRGTVMHRSYFDLLSAEETKDIMRIINHVHDILVRIVFNILDYSGTYQPTVSKKFPIIAAVDWVKKDTPASKLGY